MQSRLINAVRSILYSGCSHQAERSAEKKKKTTLAKSLWCFTAYICVCCVQCGAIVNMRREEIVCTIYVCMQIVQWNWFRAWGYYRPHSPCVFFNQLPLHHNNINGYNNKNIEKMKWFALLFLGWFGVPAASSFAMTITKISASQRKL